MAVWSSGRMVFITVVVMSYCSDFAYGDVVEDKDTNTADQNLETNCHLTSQSFYGFVVRIWNIPADNTSAHGSILAYRAIITTCSPFIVPNFEDSQPATVQTYPVEYFSVYGQKVRNATHLDWDEDGSRSCRQRRTVKEIRVHPRCTMKGNVDLYWNFAVLVLDRPFLTLRQHSYPTISLPNTLQSIVYYVTHVNSNRHPGCELPIFRHHDHYLGVFAHNMKVQSMRYLAECVHMMCEFPPVRARGSYRPRGMYPRIFWGNDDELLNTQKTASKLCETTLRRRNNYTMVCVYFPGIQSIKIGHRWMDIRALLWTGGAPLMCDGTAIGHTSTAIDRSDFYSFAQDFYVISTYVRVWSWILEARDEFGQTWLTPNYIEKEMKEKNYKPRDSGDVPPVPKEWLRSWSDDGNDDLMNRSSMNRQLLILTFGSVLAIIALTVGRMSPLIYLRFI